MEAGMGRGRSRPYGRRRRRRRRHFADWACQQGAPPPLSLFPRTPHLGRQLVLLRLLLAVRVLVRLGHDYANHAEWDWGRMRGKGRGAVILGG
eukprot:364034-Chlamydomonas_euryale.AAC.6